MTRWQALLLLAAVAVSLYAHAGVFDAFLAPTYGNTGIHQANSRELVETGFYPFQNDFSYGGGIPNLYVPLYRFALADLVLMTGMDFDGAQRWMVILFALALPLAFFAFGSVFSAWAGVIAAFFASLPAEMLVYTIRPLPQGLGLVMLAFGLALLLRGKWHAAVAGFLIALVHQEAAVFYAMAAFAYFVAGWVWSQWQKVDVPTAVNGLWAWAATTGTYFAWHFFIMGNFNVFELAQFKHHEGGVVSAQLLLEKSGWLLLILTVIGIAFCIQALYRDVKARKTSADGAAAILALSLFAVGALAVKNDLFGIAVFMDRFIVYWQYAFILLSAYALVRLVDLIASYGKVQPPRPAPHASIGHAGGQLPSNSLAMAASLSGLAPVPHPMKADALTRVK